MKELEKSQIELIKKNKWIILSSASNNNQPHCIIVQPSKIEKNQMILSNIQMNTTIKNLKENNKCCINVYCQENDMQIKIHGKSNILDSGELFNEIKQYEESNNLPENLKVRSIIIIDFINIDISKE